MSAPDAGNSTDDRQPTQTELEIQEAHRQAERRAARLGLAPQMRDGAAPLILVSPDPTLPRFEGARDLTNAGILGSYAATCGHAYARDRAARVAAMVLEGEQQQTVADYLRDEFHDIARTALNEIRPEDE